MKIGISMEMTRKLRDTWHSALNYEWYDFLKDHRIIPISCHDTEYLPNDVDLVILSGGNDMPDIKTWRDNSYPLRDQFEHKLIKDCIEFAVPVVGVCRGFHFINYVQGGTHKIMKNPYDSVKTQLKPFEVTCHHSIEIEKLAPGFELVLQDQKGVIELAVNKNLRLMGVGWHPERVVNAHTRSYILELIDKL